MPELASPTEAPKPSVVSEPATVEACRRDYESAKKARDAFAQRQRAKRR